MKDKKTQEFAEKYHQDKMRNLSLKPIKKQSDLKDGDVFLWISGMTGKCEIHTFHSDWGMGAKTYTQYNEEDGSSEIVNYSGICGIIE